MKRYEQHWRVPIVMDGRVVEHKDFREHAKAKRFWQKYNLNWRLGFPKAGSHAVRPRVVVVQVKERKRHADQVHGPAQRRRS